jgi:hypothetical protein
LAGFIWLDPQYKQFHEKLKLFNLGERSHYINALFVNGRNTGWLLGYED